MYTPRCGSGRRHGPAEAPTISSASNPPGSIDKELFEELEQKIIAKPLIRKLRRSYRLPDGLVLEVNHVDQGLPTEFWYAEVEYPTVEAAKSWQPESCGLAAYLQDEVTDQPGQSMGEYWLQTRG